MTGIFADTFYWVALLNRTDNYHAAAAAFPLNRTIRIWTTTWVLTETADALSSPQLRKPVPAFFRNLADDENITIVPPSSDLFERGIELFEQRPDKFWSLTDCISFVVMQEHGIREALTGDRHFEQAGFVALLKPPARSTES